MSSPPTPPDHQSFDHDVSIIPPSSPGSPILNAESSTPHLSQADSESSLNTTPAFETSIDWYFPSIDQPRQPEDQHGSHLHPSVHFTRDEELLSQNFSTTQIPPEDEPELESDHSSPICLPPQPSTSSRSNVFRLSLSRITSKIRRRSHIRN